MLDSPTGCHGGDPWAGRALVAGGTLRIVVCIKQVVDTSVPMEMDATGRWPARDESVLMPNPPDLSAASIAAEWAAEPGSESTAVTLGGMSARRVLRAALALGVHRALLVHDPEAATRQPIEKARILAQAVRRLEPDLVICGDRSVDSGRGIVPGALAEFLALPQVTAVTTVRLAKDGASVAAWRRLERGRREEILCPLPAVIAVDEGVAPVSYPSLPELVEALFRPIDVVEARQFLRGSGRSGVEVLSFGPLRPRPKKMLAPDSSLPAADRLRQLMSGGPGRAQATNVVTGSPQELAVAFLRFLKQQRIL